MFCASVVGPASFAQTRLYLDERVRFGTSTNTIATYHIPLVYEVMHTSVSLSRLQRALQAVVHKHTILRTRLVFDEDRGQLQQEILDDVMPPLTLTTLGSETSGSLEQILYDEETNPLLFALNEGKVIRCHAVRRSLSIDDDLLVPSDMLVFNFHHVAFDGASIDIFFRDLQMAYSTDDVLEPCTFDYIDYSIHEKDMCMDEARAFWTRHLDGFSNTHLSLPYDRYPSDNKTRSGRGYTFNIEVDRSLVDQMMNSTIEDEITLFQLGLAAFYVFLFRLAEETDICVLTVSANRYRAELENVLGFFVNTIPRRLKIDPQTTFELLVHQVKDLLLVTLAHSYLPYQDIMSELSSNVFQTLFIVETRYSKNISLENDVVISPHISDNTDYRTVAKFDLTCSLLFDMQTRSMQISLDASSELFEFETVEQMAHRFHRLLQQLFFSSRSTPICEFSLLLPHEIQLMQHLNMSEHTNIDHVVLPIHQQFAYQADKHAQKLAVILDDQSLTYAELLHLSQLLACHLKNACHVQANDIVGQCVDRSIEMVSRFDA
jgi:hypothetical protein